MNVKQLHRKYMQGDFQLKQEFMAGGAARESLLERCEQYAGWTIPTIFPEDHVVDDEEMQTDYQSVGAQAVTNLSNKIMMALFQPSRPFFRMQLDADQRAELEGSGLTPAKIDEALAEAERQSMKNLYATNARVVLNDVMQHLIVTGNTMLYAPRNGEDYVNYSLRDYIVKRDLRAKVVKAIIRETKTVNGLGDELMGLAAMHGYGEEDEVTIYTGIQRVGKNRYMVWQELEDIAYCHKKIGVYTKASLPWIPLTWNLARGKDYGTGQVELYAGAFSKLSSFANTIKDYGLIMTDIKTLVNPQGMTDVREITEAPSGAYVHGREEDLFVHQPQVANVADFLTVQFETVARQLAAAFLMNTAVTRDAERVTAEEIRMQAQELESSLGGIYSRLAAELQLPIAKRLLKDLNEIFKDIEPVIVTGLESLSRNSELDNFRAFMQDLIGLADVPEEVSTRLDFEKVISLLGAGHGVDYKKFLKDEKIVQQELKQRMQQNAQAASMEAGAVAQAQAQAQGTPQ